MREQQKEQLRVGFLGYGQMGSALAEGIMDFSEPGRIGRVRILAYAPHVEALRRRTAGKKVEVFETPDALVEASDLVVLACKPDQAEKVLGALRAALAGKPLVSIVNAWTHEMLKSAAGEAVRVQPIMPNTPVRVGRGTILLAEENSFTTEERETLRSLLEGAATLCVLPEKKIPAATALTGCGPAFFYMALEALADGGVKNGIPRGLAYELAASTMRGAGEMYLATREHPGALKDAVCSPGGTTIRGVQALEEGGMRAALIRAVDAVLS